ncbi:pseudouridine synthase [Pseudotabrizicola alkalilacus]|uniref:Dual-specificity RNA pseudouridine synthase RluA n=1 Tax=Pseudotabrizicola alkalilacus TaxID=2305252 RepID=A0A411Z500_9RHOB|nr:pseudouridine synthase [Pseudotabrizicola alkalilacus]RGP38131.1 RNA pseudouridine synthase [Pseudotabrizicola alkalilacus]
MTRRIAPDNAPSLIPDFGYDPPDVPLAILHEDAHILVVDKPAGLLSVPGKLEGRQDCLITRLQAARWDALLVHRLDCDTSGVMIFARTKQAQGFLGQEFEQRRARKTYIARVWGEMAEDRGHVDLPLGSDWPRRPRQMVDHENGRPARTDWEVIGRHDSETRVRLHPLTGRSHQLRVHMLALGHVIIGDQIYATGPARDAPRLMLHSETLSLHHPATGELVTFRAPLPF